jgi:hypothetical protein
MTAFQDEPSATAAEPLVAVPDTRAWDTSPEAPSSDSDPAAAQVPLFLSSTPHSKDVSIFFFV